MGRMWAIAATVLVILGGAGTAAAADVTAGMDVVSAYVWRGITFNDGLVLQPSVDVSSNGFGINVWGNLDVDDYDDTLDSGEFSEVDITLSYGFDLDPVSVTVGYIDYLFPNGIEGTREAFLGVSTEPVPGVSLGLTGYYDFDEVDDYYFNLGVGYAHEFNGGLAMGVSASAGYAGEDMSAGDDGGLNEYTLGVDATYVVTEALCLGAFVAYTDTFDEDVLPEQDVDVYGGASISYSF